MYIEEIDSCLAASMQLVDAYAKYRGMMEGIQENIDWLDKAPMPIIRHVNSEVELINFQFVMLPWRLLEKNKKGKEAPGGLASLEGKEKRADGDQNQTLTRVSWLLKDGLRKWPDLFSTQYKSTRVEGVKYRKELSCEALEDRKTKLLEHCATVESLGSDDIYQKIDIIRNEGYAHSTALSHKRILRPEDGWQGEMLVKELLSFGDSVMDLCICIDCYWRNMSQVSLDMRIYASKAMSLEYWKIIKGACGDD
ncbi:hypothetical protein DL237_03735 [Pseudooceanicola sediminis]|uniref:Uncharacterized protein n=2 Tax=Pseudooceanicola sediminis TaxID=2211117 RepID=A0A399J3C6_9RHOB|nr:hypothetical protein DL237_03735 [Pseudooceanicola sediminis]